MNRWLRKKTEVITYYNATKGGIDIMHQMVSWFTSKRETRRRPTIIFYNMLDITALNAFAIRIPLNTENHIGKHRNRLRRSLLVSLQRSWLDFRTKIRFKSRLLHQKTQQSESAAPCVLQKSIAKQKFFVKPVAIVFAMIILS